ncbi:MAG: hypothetical protein GF353_25915 [Candidatus Lokiarchaeota archaeon]|nr:hypothetical protein [Candidatus Lokiarchaeota archaeon]
MENKKWIFFCILGGILMLLSSVVGSTSFFALVFGIVAKELGTEAAWILSIILLIFSIIAMGGGISVIIGTIIVIREKFRLGKFIIGLGAGMGLIGLIIFLVTSIMAGSALSLLNAIINSGYGFFGVLLTIFARLKLKKPKD